MTGSLYINIETVNGVYKIRKPSGMIGSIHFSIISKNGANMSGEMSEADIDRMFESFEVWSNKVLKNLTIEGPFTYDNMPGEDQYAIYLAMTGAIKLSDEVFRVIE